MTDAAFPNQASSMRSPAIALGDKMPMLFAAVFISLCVPVFFSLGSLHLSFSRVLLLVIFPYLFFKVYTGKCGGVRWVDIAMLLFVIMLGLSIFVNNRSAFVTFVGSNAIIILGGYMAGRVLIRGPNAFIGFIKLFGGVLLFTLPFALYESQTSVMVIPRLIDQIPMVASSVDVNYRPRNGLYRVQVLFTHPIHYGLFASMCLSLIFIGFRTVLSTPKRLAWSACVVICTFTSVSSGPFLSMLAQIMLILYAWLAMNLKHKWGVLMGTFAVFYAILEVLSTRPAYFAIVERMAFNSHTAYVRKILLDYGMAQVWRDPWLGIGYNEWELPDYMSGSLDNYWLLTALVYGVPAFVFLFSAFIYMLVKAGKRDFTASPLLTDLRLAWSLVLFSLVLTLSTVAIWSDIATLVFLFLGSGVWMLDHVVQQKGEEITEPEAHRGPRYTRFSGKTALPTSRPQLAFSRTDPYPTSQGRLHT